MAITKDQIIEAAEALKSAGVNPSMAAVRERLGGGSFATISPVLREWRESQEQRATVAIEMPAEAKPLWIVLVLIFGGLLLGLQLKS